MSMSSEDVATLPGNNRRAEALEYNNKGHRKYLQVDFDDAIADYTTAIGLCPQLAVAYYNRGTVYYRLGDFQLAVADLIKSVNLEPNNPHFREGLDEARRMFRLTQDEEARR